MSSNNNEVRISTETRTVAEVIVNGTSQGKRTINGGPSLKDFCTSVAKEFGIRTFTVTVDDAPLTAAAASAPVSEGQRIAVSAKDSRGLRTRESQPPTPTHAATAEPSADDEAADESDSENEAELSPDNEADVSDEQLAV